VLSRVVKGQFVPLGRANPTVPKLLAALVESGLNPDPRLRLQSVEELAENLRPFTDDPPASVSFRPLHKPHSDPIPLVAPNRDRDLALLGTLSPNRMRVARRISPLPEHDEARPSLTGQPQDASVAPSRGFAPVTESILIAPRFPRSASTPHLQAGTDFMPMQGEPEYDSVEAERAAHTHVPARRVGRKALPALLATAVGFGLGVALAWTMGMFS
jgi:hypothetical protein